MNMNLVQYIYYVDSIIIDANHRWFLTAGERFDSESSSDLSFAIEINFVRLDLSSASLIFGFDCEFLLNHL